MPSREREFLDYYERERVDDQLKYFHAKAAWHGRRDSTLFVLAGVLMFVASTSSAIVAFELSGLGPPQLWAALATVVPALSAAIAATRSLYEHDRNRERFENTELDLEYLRATKAPSRSQSDSEYRSSLATYVQEVEALLSTEHRQWIEVMKEVALPEAPSASSDPT